MTQPKVEPEATQVAPVAEVGGPNGTPAAAPQGATGGPQTAVTPEQFAQIQEQLKELGAQLATTGQQFSEFKSSSSRRETELKGQLERASKAAELGQDSTEYRAWEREANQQEGRRQAEEQTAAAELNAGMWRVKAELWKVPQSVYQNASTAVEMENLALRWMASKGATATGSPAPDNEHPEIPQTMTLGGQGAPGQSEQDWLNRYGDEVDGGISATPQNAQRAKELKAKGMKAQPLQAL